MRTIMLVAAAALLAGCSGSKESGNDAAAGKSKPAATVAAPNGGDWSQQVTMTPAGGMLMGNPAARVKVVEFSSMTCPHCAHFAQTGFPKLVADYVKTGQVAFEFRNFVRDGLDISMALIARCNGAGPQFFTMTDALFSQQTAIFQRLQAASPDQQKQLASLPPAQQFERLASLADLPAFAAQHGLPTAKLNQCLADKAETERLVQMNSDASSNYEIEGTPTFLINNDVAKMPGVTEDKVWQTLEQRIRDALT